MATSTQTENAQAEFTALKMKRVSRPLAFLKWVAGHFITALPFNLAATVIGMLLQGWLVKDWSLKAFLYSLFANFVFSCCIGTTITASTDLFRRYIAPKRPPLDLILTSLLIVADASFGCMLATLIMTLVGAFPISIFFAVVKGSIQMSVLIGLIFGISGFFYERVKSQLTATQLQLRTKELEEERARKLALTAQLSSLESRVRPHFLFNTLNSISALISEEPERAERMVERLSGLLRFSLDSNQRSTVPLSDEIKIVNDYLEIEKVRFGSRLSFSIEIPDELMNLEVPPFCLQTLVENSIKYALPAKREGVSIKVKADSDEEAVSLSVTDNGLGFDSSAMIAGHGLDILQSRLAAVYGEKGSLEIRRDNELTVVTVIIPRDIK